MLVPSFAMGVVVVQSFITMGLGAKQESASSSVQYCGYCVAGDLASSTYTLASSRSTYSVNAFTEFIIVTGGQTSTSTFTNTSALASITSFISSDVIPTYRTEHLPVSIVPVADFPAYGLATISLSALNASAITTADGLPVCTSTRIPLSFSGTVRLYEDSRSAAAFTSALASEVNTALLPSSCDLYYYNPPKMLAVVPITYLTVTSNSLITSGPSSSKSSVQSSYSGSAGALCDCRLFGNNDGVDIMERVHGDLKFPKTMSIIVNPNGTTTSLASDTSQVSDAIRQLTNLPGFFMIDDDTTSMDPAKSTLYSADWDFYSVSWATLSSEHGTMTCVPQSANLSANLVVSGTMVAYPYVSNGTFYPGVLPDSFLTDVVLALGPSLPSIPSYSSCSFDFGGSPFYQVPVQWMTTTVNVNNVPATQATPAASIQQPVPAKTAESSSNIPTSPANPVPQPKPTNNAPSNVVASPIVDTTSSNHAPQPSNNPGPQPSPAGSAPVPPQHVSSNTPQVITIASSTYYMNSASEFIIGSKTLTPGGMISVGGDTITLGSNGLGQIVQPITTLVVGSSTYQINSATTNIIAGQTLTPGGSIVVDGNTISLPANSPQSSITAAAIVIGSSTYVANSASAYVVGGQTLTAGGRITAGGTTISLAGDGSQVAVGTQTQMVLQTTQAVNPGGVIYSAFGAPQLPSGRTTTTAANGSVIVTGGSVSTIMTWGSLATMAFGTLILAAWL